MRFLFAWQHVAPEHASTGVDGLRAVVEQLDGFELAAGAWERHVLPARVDGYEPSMLDTLCLDRRGRRGRGCRPADRATAGAAASGADADRAVPARARRRVAAIAATADDVARDALPTVSADAGAHPRRAARSAARRSSTS